LSCPSNQPSDDGDFIIVYFCVEAQLRKAEHGTSWKAAASVVDGVVYLKSQSEVCCEALQKVPPHHTSRNTTLPSPLPSLHLRTEHLVHTVSATPLTLQKGTMSQFRSIGLAYSAPTFLTFLSHADLGSLLYTRCFRDLHQALHSALRLQSNTLDRSRIT